VPICDGCGEPVAGDHIRQRIERLELSTRFRPIHIQVLLIDAASPAHCSDFFYNAASPLSSRSAAAQCYFAELAKLAGAATSSHRQLDATLAEFQHRGFFLASAVECPIEDSYDTRAAVRRRASTVVLRVRASYKPKYVALLSEPTQELIEPLRAAGWVERLILDHGAPFASPAAIRSGQERPQNPIEPAAEPWGPRLFAALSRLS
jgi:hypothetical protein